MVVDTLIVPADILNPRVPDEHFADEASAAEGLGLNVMLLDDEALRQGEAARATARIRPSDGEVLYRGWMLRSSEYKALSDALDGMGVVMLTSSSSYRSAHELPGWYSLLSQSTPRSVWALNAETTDEELLALLSGPAIVKDYVKSAKHMWEQACYIPDVADTQQAETVINNFRDIRGDDLAGGVVLREFEEFVAPEVRSWWVGGACRMITPHPDTPGDDVPADDSGSLASAIEEIQPIIEKLGCSFVSVDLARNDAGNWRVVEVGDGQVSDRPRSVDARRFLSMFAGLLA